MKKAISLIIVFVLCLGLCACNDNSTKLTLDNYDDYLNISAYVYGTQEVETDKNYWFGAYYKGNKFVEDNFYSGYYGGLSTKVVAPNYNFHNVTVKIRFTGKVLTVLENSDPYNPTTRYHSIDFEETFELNIGGTVKKGVGSTIKLPQNMLILDYGSYNYDHKYDIQADWKIVEISGTVTPA